MKKLSLTLVIYFLAMLSAFAYSGDKSDTLSIMQLKKYERNKLRAQKFYSSFEYAKGIEVFKRAYDVYPKDDTIVLNIANGFYQTRELDSAFVWYGSVINKEAIVGREDFHYLNYAELLTTRGAYLEARRWFKKFESGHPEDERVKDRLIGLDRIMEFYKDSLRFEMWHSEFNSNTYDFSPSYLGNDLLFVSARETAGPMQFFKPKYKWDQTYFLNLFKVSGENEHVEIFNRRIKTSYHEGPVAFYNNDSEVVFTRNNFRKAELRFNKKKLHVKGAKVTESEDGINKLKLFHSEKEADGTWTTPSELWFNSDEFSTGHPTISADGSKMYFASDRPGGFGETDLYVSQWLESTWSEPQNLGRVINTEGDEMFPFVDENNILYYASNGHEGLGGLDIFSIDLNDPSAKPRNYGYPINSPKDDFGLILKDEGDYQSGYFSSNREGGLGLDDIYGFNFEKRRSLPGKVLHLLTGEPLDQVDVSVVVASGDTLGNALTSANGMFNFSYDWNSRYLAKACRADYTKDSLDFMAGDFSAGDTLILRIMPEVLVIKGTITETVKGDTLENVKIYVTNEKTGEKFGMITKADGYYSFIAQPNTNYKFTLKKHRYFTETSSVNTIGKRSGEIIHDMKMEEIIIGKPIELDDIHFDLAKWNIRPDAAVILDDFTGLLNDNPFIIVELSTHTDCRGSDPYNLDLSDKRAKSSAEYVINHGIPQKRIEGKGYGETKLLNKCDDGVRCSEEEHQRNRRAEFMVTGFLPEFETQDEEDMLWISPDYLSANTSAGAKSQIVSVEKGDRGTATIQGKVVSEDGSPLANALISVMVKGVQNAIQVRTDDKGFYELKVNPGMEYRIAVQLSGYIEEGQKVNMSGATTKTADFTLVKSDK